MRMTTMRSAVVAGVLALCACGGGGPATPKVSKMESSDGTSSLLTFSADKLATSKSLDKDGKVKTENTYQYTDDRISSVSSKMDGQSDTAVTTYTYTNKQLSTAVFKWKFTSGTMEMNYTVTTNYTYAEGKLSKRDAATVIAYKDTTLNITGESKSSTTIDFTYAADGLLQRRTETEKSKDATTGNDVTKISTVEFAYDTAKKLVSATITDNADTSVATFSYDTSGRLNKISSGDTTTTLEYNTEGKVSRAISQSGSSTSTITFTYEIGNVIGLVPSISQMFDLAGILIPSTNTIPYDWMVL